MDRFQKNNPLSFVGGYDPNGSQKWLREIEKIFRVIACLDIQKVAYATHMLVDEAEYM